MKEELVRVGLAKADEYIHCPCTSHNDQTNLRTAVEKIFGTGGLEKRNVMQLLPALSDLQKEFTDCQEYLDLLSIAYLAKFPNEAKAPK